MAATLIWEDNNRSSEEIYIETTAEYGDSLTCNPDAFLVACALPAMYFGEQRIFVEGETCLELREGLKSAIAWIHHWFGKGNPNLRFEGATRSQNLNFETAERTASFFTGGVDSWSNLLINRQTYPLDHPRAIQDCFVVFGLQRVKRQDFEQAVASFEAIADEFQINFIPVYTNIYTHIIESDPKYRFWMDAYNGAALAAIGHAFAKRCNVISIASGNDIPNMVPLGTHPLIDPYLGSYNLRVVHDGVIYSRLEKTKIISKSPTVLQNLRVCDMPQIPSGYLNCGHCEKCVRTTTTLTALGVLDKTHAFPYQHLSAQTLNRSCGIKHSGIEGIYRSLMPLLEAQGRQDLNAVLSAKIRRSRLERFDKAYLNGSLFGFLRMLKRLLKPGSPKRMAVVSANDIPT